MWRLTVHLARLLAVSLTLCASGYSGAQTYPQRTVTIIVPFSAGGATDVSARLVAQLLTKQLGQTFIVENKLGAGGMIGMSQVARAAPDGYTLGWGGNSPMTIAPYMTKTPSYDPATAFTPVSLAGISSFTLVGRPGLPARSYAELVALAKEKPGQMTFSSTGNGASGHLLGEVFKGLEKVDLLHVPYKGESDGVAAMLGDQVDMTFLSTQSAIPLVKAGRLRAFLVTSATREREIPEVPSALEMGASELAVEIFFGLVAPTGTPAPIIAKLAAAMKQAVADPTYAGAMDKVGLSAKSSSPEEFAALMARHSARWIAVIKRTGIGGN